MPISNLIYNALTLPAQAAATLLFGRNTDAPFTSLVNGGKDRLRVLMLAPNPFGGGLDQYEAEHHAMTQGLKASTLKNRYHAPSESLCALERLPSRLDFYKPPILHFSGHPEQQQEGLCFLSNTAKPGYTASRSGPGSPRQVDGPAFNRVLAHAEGLKLVVFSTHYVDEDAQQLADMMGCRVVKLGSVQDSDDRAPVAFTKEFYRVIGNGVGIEKAVRQASDLVRFTSPSFKVWLFVPSATGPIIT